ncbi:MAG: hypothetical protein CMP81_23760 [Fulvimarina sp.]|nr:hypothetical protein [Fulvimarina sp.]
MRSVRDIDTAGMKTGRFGRRAGMTTGAILAAALVGTSAFAQPVPPSGQEQAQTMRPGDPAKGQMRFAERGDREGGPRWHRGRDDRGPGHRGPGRHGPRGMMMSPAKLAGALAALETGVGIQPDQMATWRTFTGALIAFAESVQPPRRGMHGMGPGPRGMEADDEADDAADAPDVTAPQDGAAKASPDDSALQTQDGQRGLFAFRMLDRFADRAIEAGDRAETLKSAMADLERTLTPEQIDTARGLVRSMMRDMRHEWRRGEHGPRHGMGPRHGGRDGHRFGDRHDGPRGPKGDEMRNQPDGQGAPDAAGPGDDQDGGPERG